MATRLTEVVVDAADPAALSRFWAALIGWELSYESADECCIVDPSAEGWLGEVAFVPNSEPRVAKNSRHLDLASASLEDQAAIVERAVDLGAKPIDVGQGDVPWVVLADPEGNEFCVLDPREEYRECGSVAAVIVEAADPAAMAEFWSVAAGMSVARSSDRIVSLRHASGRGPWLEFLRNDGVNVVKHRIHLDTAPFKGDDHDADVAGLVALGAKHIDIGQGDSPWKVLVDPEGGVFCVLTPR
ncbi:VOC family protein [Solihabitans fulvus]|uniref:VOC family protein n=1 Tax=Solihabitans fulvus TaxID=1892852 RepID=A0A5B2WZU3_9PSEU|nr:VOC family protein [Solihabitans fulvus]KAA2256520.1 VOC family protein [Solihabitans fulvus]